jgi:RNA polymerase sigma-70 factor (ECF subfamily)
MMAAVDAPLADLLRRVGNGDEPALGDLQQQTRISLARSIRRIVTDPWHGEEVLQDVYTYVWRHAAEYRDDRGTPAAWLHMLARSRAIDRRRLSQRDRGAVEFNEQDGSVASTGPLCQSHEVWQHFHVRTRLQELPPCQRRLLQMAFFAGFSHSEIAARTGTPLGTVKTKIRKALLTLRETLAETKLPRAS